MRLTDCFMEVIAYVVYFLKAVQTSQPPFDRVKAEILRLFMQSEQACRNGSFSPEDCNLGRFAVCAWIDEAILNSAWAEKQLWQKEQLQRLFYQTTEAGEEFFDRLNKLGLHQRDVREIYYLCLVLGFKGRFIQPGDEHLLEQLKGSNLKLLMGSSLGGPSLDRIDLFPDAYPAERFEIEASRPRFQFSPFTVACMAGPVILFGALFFIYRFVLSGVGENLIK
ncbi:MAG: DotU family type IV/VI secretion system protein [Pseudomonadota bacterium]